LLGSAGEPCGVAEASLTTDVSEPTIAFAGSGVGVDVGAGVGTGTGVDAGIGTSADKGTTSGSGASSMRQVLVSKTTLHSGTVVLPDWSTTGTVFPDGSAGEITLPDASTAGGT
jgi:hypothetical protein